MSKSKDITNYKELADSVEKAMTGFEKAQAKFQTIESELIETIRKQYEVDAKSGNFCKSYNVEGNKSRGFQVIFSDKFKNLPIESEDEIIKTCGKSHTDLFDKKRDVVLIKTDDKTISELVNILGAQKFQELFKVRISMVVKKGFDELQFKISQKIRKLVEQYKPSVKRLQK